MSNSARLQKCKNKYFAASNSYDGFVSYFDKCFSSDEHDKVFIIKGGPGTGKSSLMKKVAQMGDKENFEVEEIYCSSDINSLDGVIIRNGERSIAVLDGTAPHERDASVPGAVDMIISLYDFFNISGLEDYKNKIRELIKNKNTAYRKAYDQLNISSVFHRKSRAEKLSFFDYERAEEEATLLIRAIYTEGERKRGVRLISAFGKDGYVSFDTLDSICKRIYSIKADPVFSEAFIKILETKLFSTDCNFYIIPSPLDRSITEAIYLPDNKTAVIVNGKGGSIIDANKFVKSDYDYNDELKEYDIAANKMLEGAKKYFALSSKYHFELEKIYSSNVNFDAINDYCENLISYIKKLLS